MLGRPGPINCHPRLPVSTAATKTQDDQLAEKHTVGESVMPLTVVRQIRLRALNRRCGSSSPHQPAPPRHGSNDSRAEISAAGSGHFEVKSSTSR
jgi:predicted aspartyl protease